jgi:hypothetical protein
VTATATHQTIGEFFVALSKDPQLLATFELDVEQALEESGLSLDDRELVQSGDITRIHKAIRGEGDGWDSIVWTAMSPPNRAEGDGWDSIVWSAMSPPSR